MFAFSSCFKSWLMSPWDCDLLWNCIGSKFLDEMTFVDGFTLFSSIIYETRLSANLASFSTLLSKLLFFLFSTLSGFKCFLLLNDSLAWNVPLIKLWAAWTLLFRLSNSYTSLTSLPTLWVWFSIFLPLWESFDPSRLLLLANGLEGLGWIISSVEFDRGTFDC